MATISDSLGPRDAEAERAVLGSCFASGDALTLVLSSLDTEDFFFELHREMYEALRQAALTQTKNEGIDPVMCAPYCSEEAGEALKSLWDAVPIAANASHYCRVVKDAAKARRTLTISERIKAKVLSGEHEDAPEYGLSLLEEEARRDMRGDAEIYQAARDDLRNAIRMRRQFEGVTGIRTGLSKMDKGLGGLNSGLSYIIAARPSTGKSLVLGQIALTAANQDYRVLLATPEMSWMLYLDRLSHSVANVDYERGRQGSITDKEERDINAAAEFISKLPIYVDDHGTQTTARIRANVMRHKPDLLLVDYLQYLMPLDTKASRTQQVGQISRDLSQIKSDFNIPVVLAAQLNRSLEARHDKRPTLSDLRDSGEIEQDADAVMFLHRPGRYDADAPQDELEIHCEKWRLGSLWAAKLFLRPGHNWLVNSRGEVA